MSSANPPRRPTLLSTPSTRPLMDDTSPAVTPSLDHSEDPFGTPGVSQRTSTVSSAESSASAVTPPLHAPKIHINSVPHSPDPSSTSAPSFIHPFAASGKSIDASESSDLPRSKSNGNSMRSRGNKDRSSYRNSKKPLPRSTSGNVGTSTSRKAFQSTRLKEEIYKPWLEKRDPAQRWAKWITIVCIILGVAIAAVICYDGYASIPNLGKTCLVLDDNFETFNKDVWEHEVRLDGYGNGQFEWTTASENNTFVRDGKLYIVPTLTSDVLGEDAITNGYTLNLTSDGTCTSTNITQCVAVSNSSLLTVINPVRSARIHTKNSVSIKYGKVEVKARMPTGDWIWPAIWMLPVNHTYGAWPRSGEIDIVESRGNNISYPNRGFDYAQSALHWGPTVELDRYWKTWGYRQQRRTYYNEEFHTFGLEWNDKYLWTYIDSKVSQVVSLRFKKDSFWNRGFFPSTIVNDSSVVKLTNPWIQSDNNVAPFDQAFYLIIDVAVGGTNGYFPDGEGSKPWVDGSGTSMSDFWIAKDRWWKTWPEDVTKRGLAVDSVKMWKTC